jgi:glycosyltransferase involved in cell wall biosynthesis
MQRVNVGQKFVADYYSLVGRAMADEIRQLAERLRGRRMLHVSATAFGGGVAEINYTLIPLLTDAGVEAEWRVLHGQNEFYDVTKTIHNALQGNPQGLSAEQREIFERYNRLNAEALADADEWDVIVVHDPQPLALRRLAGNGRACWVWRCHIDLSTPNQEVLAYLSPEIRAYDACIFHMPAYVPRDGVLREAVIWPPAIDPLAPKNMALAPDDAAYNRDIFILSNLNNVGAVEVNAFQVHADVCLQKSIREGFGLTVAEALWKARPVVAGRAGGIVGQIADGETGFLVATPEECARRAVEVLADPSTAAAMARRGKEVVRRRFLMPRLVRDWLALMHRLDGNGDAAPLDVLEVGA